MSTTHEQQQEEEPLTISLATYLSGLGRPGIVPPKLSSALVITGTPAGAQVVRHEFQDNKEPTVDKSELSAQALATVFALVDELQTLPKRGAPGGSDIYGANTSVEVRRGRKVLWGHSPGGGCGMPDDDEEETVAALGIDDTHRESFASIVGKIYGATAVKKDV
ncbi:hypothetical protein GGI24_001350 [Coemansia furcata]|nr:hypothetical protein GGI24_001350 [Coemansia furcata]